MDYIIFKLNSKLNIYIRRVEQNNKDADDGDIGDTLDGWRVGIWWICALLSCIWCHGCGWSRC